MKHISPEPQCQARDDKTIWAKNNTDLRRYYFADQLTRGMSGATLNSEEL